MALCALEKSVAMFATGFNDDEAYTVVISRGLALSYFDHPPLHQWIVHAFAALFGEGHGLRAPFWLMNIGASAGLFGLTRRLFDSAAAYWALFLFNATAYFLVLPDGFIMPDTPLLMCLTLAAWATAELLYGPPRREGPLWLMIGAALGAAGLSKYSAIFVPAGLLGFLLTSPRHRHWLWDPRAYFGAALALAIFSPALIWNARHGWVSFAFQSHRAAASLSLDGKAWTAVLEGLGAQLALLSPWAAIAVALGLARATRGDANSPERFLLWQAAPPLLLFAAMPLLGERAIPHWFNSGWIFAYPLAGAWLASRSQAFRAPFATVSAALAGLTVAFYLAAVTLGPSSLVAFAPRGAKDPTRYAYDWPSLAESPAWKASPPAFVVVDNWRVGGRVGVALGPKVPVCAFNSDPRGFAFQCDPAAHLGQDALIVLPQETAELEGGALGAYFQSTHPSGDFSFGRRGRIERTLSLIRADRLLKPYPLPYGPGSP